jgi:hypothetical protein
MHAANAEHNALRAQLEANTADPKITAKIAAARAKAETLARRVNQLRKRLGVRTEDQRPAGGNQDPLGIR